jgi:hypothetical protein
MLARSIASLMQISPNLTAGTSASPPPYAPIAVRTALTITASCNTVMKFFSLLHNTYQIFDLKFYVSIGLPGGVVRGSCP